MNRKSKPKVLKVARFNLRLTDARQVKAKYVVFCFPDETGKRTKHYGVSVLVKNKGERMHKGVDARYKDITVSRVLKQESLESMIQDAVNDVSRSILGSLKGVKAKVRWWDESRGEGCVDFEGMPLSVYGCNIRGAKTGYPETACMNLVEGSEVTGDLFDFGNHVSLVNIIGGIFDEGKWNSLDQSRLAFKKDENGNFINGLFASGCA